MPTQVYSSVGRRKEAAARVRVLEGNSQVTVNGKPISEVFRGIVFQKAYQQPFEATKTLGKLTATVKVEGGGQVSQLKAVVHGLSRSLGKINSDYHLALKKQGLLTRDPRVKERRKFGLAHKARAKKQSPKR
ncbi:MAG: 30S ribosomal protein S9 [Patescibacteria group bacterium]|nr:30S ribosomal protein S9 [Patescibacteria group bacterium]